MSYLNKIPIMENVDGTTGSSGNTIEKSAVEGNVMEQNAPVLYVTDDPGTAEELKSKGEAVLIYLHEGNKEQDFAGFLYAVEDPDNLDPEYAVKVYQRMKGCPGTSYRQSGA